MWKPVISVIAAALMATPINALASDTHPAETLSDLLEATEKADTKTPQRRKIRLQEDEISLLEARMTRTYGEPTTSRHGLAVWDVPLTSPVSGQAETVTVMIGRDRQDRPMVVIDDRAAETRSMMREERKANREARKANRAARQPNPRNSAVLRPEERD